MFQTEYSVHLWSTIFSSDLCSYVLLAPDQKTTSGQVSGVEGNVQIID
jgi:hypothetical protein